MAPVYLFIRSQGVETKDLHSAFKARQSLFTTASSAADYFASTTEPKMILSPPWDPSKHVVVELRIKNPLETKDLKLVERAFWSYDTAKNDMVQCARDAVRDRLSDDEEELEWQTIGGANIIKLLGVDGVNEIWAMVSVEVKSEGESG